MSQISKVLETKPSLQRNYLDKWISPENYRKVQAFEKGTINASEVRALKFEYASEALTYVAQAVMELAAYPLGGACIGGVATTLIASTVTPIAGPAIFIGICGAAIGLVLGSGMGISAAVTSLNQSLNSLAGITNPALGAKRALDRDVRHFWENITTMATVSLCIGGLGVAAMLAASLKGPSIRMPSYTVLHKHSHVNNIINTGVRFFNNQHFSHCSNNSIHFSF